MNFPYLKLPGLSRRPLVPVYLKFGSKSLYHPVLCLVDSGADVSYLDTSLAKELGIDLSKVKPIPSWGINGEMFLGRPVKLVATIGDWEFQITAIFSDKINRAFCVLGQEGLFDQAGVTFERYKWNLNIRPRTDFN